MENHRLFLDPEDMTPDERFEEILELLAIASVRLATKERDRKPESKPSASCPDTP